MVGDLKIPDLGGNGTAWGGLFALTILGAGLVDTYVLDPIRDEQTAIKQRQLRETKDIKKQLDSIINSVNEVKLSQVRVEERVIAVKERLKKLDERIEK